MNAMLRARLAGLVPAVLLLVLSAGCRGPEQPYRTITAHVSPLKEQFNADAGKTRILILPAPN